MATFICFLIITTCCAPKIAAMQFNLAQIGLDNHNKDILTDGEGTYISKEGVQFTCPNKTRTSRATYVHPLHLWDVVSGQMADFNTHFSFVMDSRNASDGVSFFLAENTSLVTTSGAMGLPVVVPFVGVEFEKWWSNVSSGDELTVMIRYDSRYQSLSVSQRGTIVANKVERHYKVDLRSVLPEWVVFGFSSSSCNQFHKTSVRSWSFNSTVLHDDTRRREEEKKKEVLVFILVALLFVTVIGLFRFIFIRKNRSIRPVPSAAKSLAPREFTLEELTRATNNFDSCQIIGKGGFGVVYKATLANGEKVAVKEILRESPQGIKTYEAELLVGGAPHKHLVKLIGWCNEGNKDLLVYELMENKSLETHLFDLLKDPLPSDTRYKIVQGLAKALHYLHEECGYCILHRDIKASNVLLDSNFEAKLGDFGLAKLTDDDQSVEISDPAGTIGYMPPECLIGGASPKYDVYSFGVVALELATGRSRVFSNDGHDVELVKWVEKMYQMKKIREIVDPRLDDYDDLQMKGLIALGLWCVRPDSNDRPLMREIVHALNNTQDRLSDLHHKIPGFDNPLELSPEIYLEIDLTEEGVVPSTPSYPPLFMWPHFLFLSPLRFLLGSSWPRSLQYG